MKALTVIQLAVDSYNENKNDLTVEQLQDLRDDISISLVGLAGHFADCKMSADAAEYVRKSKIADVKEGLTGGFDERTGKKYTASSTGDQALLKANKEYAKERLANREFDYIRKIFDAANAVMNSMASRINIGNRYGQ